MPDIVLSLLEVATLAALLAALVAVAVILGQPWCWPVALLALTLALGAATVAVRARIEVEAA